MTVYDPYTNTFYDNSKKQDVITSDKTMIPVPSLKKLSIMFGIHYPGLKPPFEEPCEDVIKGGCNDCVIAWMPLPKPYESQNKQPEISSYYGLKSYVRERSE